MPKNLTITDDKVREAAEQCPDAAKVLKTMFPDAFPPKPVETVPLVGPNSSTD